MRRTAVDPADHQSGTDALAGIDVGSKDDHVDRDS